MFLYKSCQFDTVDGSEIWGENQLRVVVYPIIDTAQKNPRWCRISFINSMLQYVKEIAYVMVVLLDDTM